MTTRDTNRRKPSSAEDTDTVCAQADCRNIATREHVYCSVNCKRADQRRSLLLRSIFTSPTATEELTSIGAHLGAVAAAADGGDSW